MTARPAERLHYYSVFGLVVASELRLPELFEASPVDTPDVSIRAGAIDAPSNLRAGVHLIGSDALLVVDDAGRYLVSEGSRIVVEAKPGATDKNVRLYLLGSVFGLLIHQRGLLPLHANAVELHGGAIAFVGASGAGKSTLAAWLHDRGNRILADDVCVVGIGCDGDALAYPGLPRLRLWKESLAATNRDPADFPFSFEGDESYDKRDVFLKAEGVARAPLPLKAIIELASAATPLTPLHGAAAVDVIMSNTYRGAFVPIADLSTKHWQLSIALARRVPVFRGFVDRSRGNLDQSFRPLLDAVASALSKEV